MRMRVVFCTAMSSRPISSSPTMDGLASSTSASPTPRMSSRSRVPRPRLVRFPTCRQSNSTSEFTTLLQLEAQAESGKRFVVAGTLFGKNDNAKLVHVNGVWLDSTPEGEMIVVENADVPGVIGKVATLLGDNGLNIASVSWGRTAPGGEALTVINVDQEVTADVLSQLRAIPPLRNVRHVVV